jgi:transposase
MPMKQEACPDCGGKLKPLGEDVSEMLEHVPAHWKVIRQVRSKLACACCDKIAQAEAPSRPIARRMAGPGLLAHALVSKSAEHLPLYPQEEIYPREGIELERSTLTDWVDGASKLLQPLVEALRRHVLAAQKVHANDTLVPVLAPGNGKTKTRQLWTYVRDNRPAGGRPFETVLVFRVAAPSSVSNGRRVWLFAPIVGASTDSAWPIPRGF